MPISDPWTDTDEIFDEFGATSKPDDIADAYTRIFTGSPSVGNSWVTPFEGYGKPSISGFTANTSATGGGFIDLDFTVTRNNLDAKVIVQYQENSGGVPDPGSWLDNGNTETYSTDGAKIIDYQVPKTNQSYHIRLQYYNKFNDQATGDYQTVTYDTATSSDVATLITPDLSAGTVEYSGQEGYLSFTYNDDEGGFTVECEVDGNPSAVTPQCDKNVDSGNNPKEIRIDFNDLPSAAVEFRVKATSTTLNDSAFSSWETATSVPSVPGCPL